MYAQLVLYTPQVCDTHTYNRTVEADCVFRYTSEIHIPEITAELQVGIIHHHIIDTPV